ncbi:hypothetical protein [endosymbiont GvMRE of Glomus versiforme]|uniref:hypothetical protein n=1 Tax=endosymbiont GvMRE of Glomus versiforme TaxID=2039283 RepID=UPI000ED49458|nr:hypothetical protein [endosymbiont GvMRE of Glomus versiforme]RHZ35532.1 hypothetical protein GvMRE_IIg266 [endosymbiont GvMRE of Glomus versiforme]
MTTQITGTTTANSGNCSLQETNARDSKRVNELFKSGVVSSKASCKESIDSVTEGLACDNKGNLFKCDNGIYVFMADCKTSSTKMICAAVPNLKKPGVLTNCIPEKDVDERINLALECKGLSG